mgnify:CR=1 FL=1
MVKSRQFILNSWIASGMTCVILFTPQSLVADYSTFEPALHVKTLHNDNLLLESQKDSGIETTTTLEGEMGYFTETSSLNSIFKLQKYNYRGVRTLSNRDDYTLGLIGVKHNERNTWRVDVKGIQDSTATDILDIEPDDIGGDVGEIQDDVKRQRYYISPSWRHDITEKSQIDLRYNYSDLQYDNSSKTNLVESNNHNVTTTYFVGIDEQNTLLTNISGSYFESDNNSEYEIATINMGNIHRFDELSSARILVGYYSLEAEVPGLKDNDNNFLFEISGQYDKDTTSVFVSAERILVPGNSGDVFARNQIRFNLSGMLMLSWSYNIEGRHYRNQSIIKEISDNTRRQTSIRTSLGWQISNIFDINLGYHYKRQKESTKANSNAIFMVFNYKDLFSN